MNKGKCFGLHVGHFEFRYILSDVMSTLRSNDNLNLIVCLLFRTLSSDKDCIAPEGKFHKQSKNPKTSIHEKH